MPKVSFTFPRLSMEMNSTAPMVPGERAAWAISLSRMMSSDLRLKRPVVGSRNSYWLSLDSIWLMCVMSCEQTATWVICPSSSVYGEYVTCM